MARICNNLLETVGNTPLVRLNSVTKDCKATILAKLEYFNPGLSVKDRIALNMVEAAEKAGTIKPGVTTIVEPTSGNTGIGLAMVSAVKGYKCILVMPDTMSLERRSTMAAYGAEVLLTPGAKGMPGAIKKALELQTTMKDVWIPQQFENADNPAIHEETTGPEIWRDTAGAVDYVVSGVGTGGTITGSGRFLKKQKSTVKMIAVEPFESAVLSGEKSGPHKIQGIGAGFVPKTYASDVVDEVIKVKSADAISMAQRVAAQEGIMVGISSGAAVCGAVELGSRPEMEGKTIVVIIPDTGVRYLSSPLFASINDAMAKLPTTPVE